MVGPARVPLETEELNRLYGRGRARAARYASVDVAGAYRRLLEF